MPPPVYAMPIPVLRLPPAIGFLAVTFGLLALIKLPILFGPLAVLLALIAAFRRQFWYAAVGGVTGAAAVVTSTSFWLLVGLGWLARYLF